MPNEPEPVRAYVALGSNLGDREAWLAFARDRLAKLAGTTVIAASIVEETLPLGGRQQPPYLNQMIALDTRLSPEELLAACHAIEVAAGRTRRIRWESRTLDLDLVQYGNLRMDQAGLTLPHPGLAERDFWRRELEELHRRCF